MKCCNVNDSTRKLGKFSCDCHDGNGFKRNYYTQAERIESLEAYKKSLENELAGVQEKISELS